MADRKQTFTPEFRAEAVRLVHTSGRSRLEVAADLGVARSTLHHWIDGQRGHEVDAPPADWQECGFRWKPATHSDAKPASVSI